MAQTAANQHLFDAFFDAKREIDEEEEGELVLSSNKVTSTVMNDEEVERDLEISRDPQFYKNGAVKIGPRLKLRVYYHTEKAGFFVFFRKKNDTTMSSTTDDTHMVCPPHNIKRFWQNIQKVTDEVDMTPWDDIPESHKCDEGVIEDKDNQMYWSPNIALWLPDKSLAVRSYKNSTGYFIRILMARKFQSGTFPGWIGRTLSMRVPEARRFIVELQRSEEIIHDADEVRIGMVKQLLKKRDDKEQMQADSTEVKKVTFEEITPPLSPSHQ